MLKNKKSKMVAFVILILLTIAIMIFSYNGFFGFTRRFNEFDYLVLNIVGDAVMVGIVTYFSTMKVSNFISKKEFERNNKINVSINSRLNNIVDYKSFMELYNNSDVFFAIDEEERKVIDYVYKTYEFVLTSLQTEGIERQLLDIILNIPFFINFLGDENVIECYEEIFKKFNSEKFNNITILKNLFTKEDYVKLEKFSNMVLNFKHFEMTNLNNIEGCQILLTANDVVACKISCLPNHKYDIYSYYDIEKWLQFIAFSFDYDSNEYYTNLLGVKYTIDTESKPAKISLNDYMKFK